MVPDALARVFEMMDTPPIQNNYALFYIRKYIFSIVLNSGFILIVRSTLGRVGAPLTVVHPSQNSGHAAFPHPALCETNRSHYHSYILTYIQGLTSG
mgnify:CR=1